jgi:hypothetical protein
MDTLPKFGQFVEMCSRNLQNLSNVRPLGIRRSNSVFACGQIHISVHFQINDHFGLAQECVNMSWRMVTGIDDKQDAANLNEPVQEV